jgi:hypothetical protein
MKVYTGVHSIVYEGVTLGIYADVLNRILNISSSYVS